MANFNAPWANSWMNGHNSGVLNYQKQTLESLEGSGVATLNEVRVEGKTHFNGTFMATASTFFSSFNVNGTVDAVKSIFSKSVTINGPLNAVDSTFQDQVSISTEKATLENSTVEKEVIFRRSSASKEVLTLSKGSVIKGSVTFEGSNGKIKLLDESKILGSITGAIQE